MPSSDYTNAIGGGLKLKGAKDAGIKKHKKKSHKSKTEQQLPASDSVAVVTSGGEEKDEKKAEHDLQKALAGEDEHDSPAAIIAVESGSAAGGSGSGKTDAQRRHDEIRRKRLDERLQREGVKTHKQRVEELNKYLSRLSEHHDMPRIGPG